MTVSALLDALSEFATDDVIISVTADEYGWQAVTRRPDAQERTDAGSKS
jgi:hypothetical protein